MIVQVYDKAGDPQTVEWALNTYNVGMGRASAEQAYRLVELREIEGPNTLTATILDVDGTPLQGVDVCFFWPDAPVGSGLGWYGRAQVIPTNEAGRAEFCMGPGSYYWVPPEPGHTPGGPHNVWVRGQPVISDVVTGLGMLARTNHRHLNLTFRWDGPPEEPEPLPDLDAARWTALFARLDNMSALLNQLVDAQVVF